MSNSKFSDHVCNWGHTVPERVYPFYPPFCYLYTGLFKRVLLLFSHLLHESSILLLPHQSPQHIREPSPVRDSITFPSVLSVLHPGTQLPTEYRSGMIESSFSYLTTIFLPHYTRNITSVPYFISSYESAYYRKGSGNLTQKIEFCIIPKKETTFIPQREGHTQLY